MSCHVLSCRVMLCQVMSGQSTPCHVMSCRIMSCDIITYLHTSTQIWVRVFNIGALFFGLGVIPTLQRAPLNATFFGQRGPKNISFSLENGDFRII